MGSRDRRLVPDNAWCVVTTAAAAAARARGGRFFSGTYFRQERRGNLVGSPRGFAGQVKGRSEVMWRKRPPSSPGVAKAVVDLRKA